jgi:N-acetylneuraminate synthase
MKFSKISRILKSRPYIIAEIGANHNGSLLKAKKQIRLAKKAGCNAVKFQSWDENLNSEYMYKKNKKLLKDFIKYKLTFADLLELRRYSKKIKIDFGTTVFNDQQLKEAINIKCDFIKIASMDINNTPLLKLVSKIRENLIVSTGFAVEKEIVLASKILKKFKKKNIIFLHCVSLYPPKKIEDINLLNIKHIKKITGFETGFSDHTIWDETCLVATSLGSVVLEKHFTDNKKSAGWDHSISADFKEMKSIVNSCKKIKGLTGKMNRQISQEEIKQGNIMKRSVITSKDIEKNQKFSYDNLTIQRPGTGLEPKFLDTLIGKKSWKNIKKGTILKKKTINYYNTQG